jgi:hypothetical protein
MTFSDGSKARRLGFHEYVEPEQMFFDLFDELKKQKVIPDYNIYKAANHLTYTNVLEPISCI